MADKGIVAPLLVHHGASLDAPVVTGATTPQVDRVRVAFDQEMIRGVGAPYSVMDHTAYSFIGSESITPASTVLVQDSPTIVEVLLNEMMTNGAPYTVTADGVKSIYGEIIDPNAKSAPFTGYALNPEVESAAATDATTIRVQFDKLMMYDSELEKATNYTFSGPTTLDPAVSVVAGNAGGKTHADVTISKEMFNGGSYDIIVANVSDTGGNPLAGAPNNQASFTGIGVAPQVDPAALPQTAFTVRVVFDEQVLNAGVGNEANYTILPALVISSVENVVDAYTYELTTELQANSVTYTVTVGSAVTDVAGNPIDPAHDEATWLGVGESPPEIWMDPDSGSEDVQIRTKMRVTARDVEREHTGINVSTFAMTVAHVTAGGGTLVRDVVKAGDFSYVGGEVVGSYQPGFTGKVTGDPLDQETGVMFHFIPKENWIPDTLYTITATAQDNEGTPNTNTLIGTFRTDAPICFEDDLSARTTLDDTLINGLAYPNCEQVRKILMRDGSTSTSQLVRARTLMHLATMTELRVILADNFDYTLVDEIRLCDRQSVLTVHSSILKYMKNVRLAINEVPRLTNETRDFLRRYV